MATATGGAQNPGQQASRERDKKNVVGILIDPVSRASAANIIMEAGRNRQPLSVSALAVHGVMTGVLDPAHRYRLNNFDLVVADGQPVRWALNHLHRAGLPERVYGPSLTVEVLRMAADEGVTVFFYGSTPEVLASMQRKIAQSYPGVVIAGVRPSRFEQLTEEEADLIAEHIRDSGAQIVFAGLGCPRQEVWAYEFRRRLGIPIVAVGAAFPFIAGTLRQAPRWMQDRGLEWLFRLCMEPRRLWRRYLLLSPAYIFLVLCQLLGFRFSSEGQEPEQEELFG